MREAFEKEEEAVPVFQYEEVVPYVPAFAREIEQQSEDASPGALRGTAMHRIMECYQFSSRCVRKRAGRRDAGERTDHTGDAWTDSHTAG